MEEKIRVLIIDDNPDWKHDLKKNVSDWGHQPIVARDAGYDLMDDAIHLNNMHCCHIALVDMNLFDYPTGDHSGLDLAKSLLPTIPIGISGYSLLEPMKKTLKDVNIPIQVFWGKEERPEDLEKIIHNVVTEEWDFLKAKNAKIDWPNNISSESLTAKFRTKTDICSSEIETLLLKHFKDSQFIQLELQDSSYRTNGLSFAFRGSSAVFKATTITSETNVGKPTLIKFARKERVQQEELNYKSIVKGSIDSRDRAELRKSTLIWHIGLVEYGFLNNRESNEYSLPTFAEFYVNAKSEELVDITEFIENLYSILDYSSASKSKTQLSLFRQYSEAWDPSRSQGNHYLLNKLKEFSNQSKRIQYPSIDKDFKTPNPVKWILNRVDRNGNDSSPKSGFVGISHGDMHAENILVDKSTKRPFLIDFERSGVGPISQDFVLLEEDILLRLTNLHPSEFLTLFSSILSLSNNVIETGENQIIFENEEMQKAWLSINNIREMLKQKTNEQITIYLWGLLLNIGFRCSFLDQQIKTARTTNVKLNKQRELNRNLLYGGLICLKLENPKEKWPPAQIKKLILNLKTQDLPDLQTLFRQINSRFNISEIRIMIFEVTKNNMDYEDFEGNTKKEKVLAFVQYLSRREQLQELIDYCKKESPNSKW